ncbi:MAG: pyridoxamine 5'-phosphate oxidase family protein [Desulfobacterales bacterium]|jgi:hypothetical protein|nr:pyridoxamine 5'-phosphate oxidase family protein [Desulfobacterales bacterium]
MKSNLIVKALTLSEKLRHVFIATADGTGLPHMAAAGKIKRISDDRISIEAWFCPGTVENLNQNNRISIVVWEPDPDQGYQLTGKVEKVEELAILNGFSHGIESMHPIPQVERKLIVHVEKTFSFTHAPHNDFE